VIFLIGRNAVKVIVREYVTKDGKKPFSMWIAMLDTVVQDRIRMRLARFTTGNLGDHKSLLDGLWEARLAFGPGYRIYFGRDGKAVIVLVGGGSKATQRQDIWRARRSWRDYLNREQHG
jgi:putative addiction module killer protein